MTILKKNIAANFAGNAWQALMALAFIPLYIKFMGVEAYGLIGIFTMLQGLFVLLDMGLGATLTRETARLSVLPEKKQEIRNLSRSLEVIYWGVAIFIGICIAVLAPFIARYWVKASQLSPQTIEQAIRLMGFAMALQWPASFYSGGLIGLQRQVLLNVINSLIGTLRGAGAVLILWLISPTIQAFFLWQMVISVVNTGFLAFSLWRALPQTDEKTVFQRQLLAGVWRFAADMSIISILATIVTQLDKVILSKMLALEAFGYYTLAGVVGMSLYRLIGPVTSAVYPRFTQLVSLSDSAGLKQLYHKSSQFMSVLILPVTAVIAMFSYEVIFLWTQNTVTAERCYLLVSVLIYGTALNGLMSLPYALQVAYGWTRLALLTTLAAVIVLVPTIVLLTGRYGALGGASAWLILNSGHILITIGLMHRRLLPTEKWKWYFNDVGIPLMVSLAIAGTGRLLIRGHMSQPETIAWLVVISVTTLAATVISTRTTRDWAAEKLAGLF